MKWYSQEASTILKELDTSRIHGLTGTQSQERLEQYGPNELAKEEREPAWKMLLKSFKEPLIVILLIAIGLALASAAYDFFVSGDQGHAMASVYEATAIILIVIINSGLTFHQTRSAQKSLDAISEMRQHHMKVLRDNNWTSVSANHLVPGDIVSVKSGDFIEGDLRWLKTSELQINESHLTGESDAIQKTIEVVDDDTELGDRTNMGYSGSMVVNGNGIGVVVATGMNTELGKISGLMQDVDDQKTPIEKSVHSLSKKLMIIAAVIIAITIGYDLVKQLIQVGSISMDSIGGISATAIAIAVASIPDAMPVVLSIVLTIGAKMMASQKGLVKSLSSVETLGSATYIASDKTGTLTKNEMAVTRFLANGKVYNVEGNGYTPIGDFIRDDGEAADSKDYQRFLEVAVLNNEAEIKPDNKQNWRPFGNPTDVSLVVLAAKEKIKRDELLEDKGNRDIDIIRIFPFDSTRKMMTVVIKENGKYYSLTKGAPDIIKPLAKFAMVDGEAIGINQVADDIETIMLEFANDALRTISITQREITREQALNASSTDLERDLTFLGLVGIIDPPREEVKASVRKLTEASVNVVMITGDHAMTAKAIAKQLGIIKSNDARVITGREIEEMTDAQLFDEVLDTRVYARVTPEHKQRIIKQLQEHEQVVGMTGDGINDAPALKAADIGIAMGINGTEVTKDAADLILLDDKFTTIEKSVESGRTIFANILNFMRHELTTNVAEVLSLLLGVFLITSSIGNVTEVTPTLTALMVLWVNMISDSLPSFALGYDEAESDVMKQKPRDAKQSVLANGMLRRVLFRGGVMGGMVFLAFVWAAMQGFTVAQSQTIAFLTLVFGQLWHVYDARSVKTLFDRNPFSNSRLTLAVGFAATSSILVTLSPFFNNVMGTAPLSMTMYISIIVISAIPTFVISGIKKLIWNRNQSNSAQTLQLDSE
ncbi:cation-transporting P-type ATPase [Lentilactobacillus otakiensis]|uniref:Cation-transporting ATPase, E1-E2 family protein n=1 Tax=Lentilactobacillus otakiensis DSM 19908 = JCM 15040 TaxID=1423780 RepID=S4PP71_9LACO|nr:cation-transporting P-type ATPase [Lentilactobacillus otakiensis]KRL10279.1 e1-E2 ATPase [Lentilactobacillus otakiensis DSM 19908 = JCM 15040]MBZ3777383.1 cation-transporting P-type ATPase [Lentilactobacillus otakiensis]MDV3517328.1 cation-transporting P-type ATPase [Lentilactobacillus otakiensis]GAD16300.1 cation-transporting ATPase, E1-E2 family protein [Lentilactobacillus otakiensis DSM 19908 = JCM 15040]